MPRKPFAGAVAAILLASVAWAQSPPTPYFRHVNPGSPSGATDTSAPVPAQRSVGVRVNAPLTLPPPQMQGGSVAYSLAGALPAGMAFDAGSGALSGRPSAPGSYALTVTARDPASGARQAILYALSVAAPPKVTLAGYDAAVRRGGTVSLAPHAEGILGTPEWSLQVVSGVMPQGLAFDPASGRLSGSPSTSGAARLSFSVTDGADRSSGVSDYVDLTVRPALTTAYGTPLVDARKGVAATTGQPTTNGAAGAVAYAIAPAAPGGMAFSAATGILSGTPSAVLARTTYTVTATDGLDQATATAAFDLQVSDAATAAGVSDFELHLGQDAREVSFVPTFQGASGAVAWRKGKGTLPAGTDVDAATGQLTGVVTGGTEGQVLSGITLIARDPSGTEDETDPFSVTLRGAFTVSDAFPDVSTGDVRPLYDAYNASMANTEVTVPDSILFTFDRPRLADQFRFNLVNGNGGGEWVVRYRNAAGAWVTASQGSCQYQCNANFDAGAISAREWAFITTKPGRVLEQGRFSYGGIAPTAPSLSEKLANPYPVAGQAYAYQLQSWDTVGQASWTYAGELPPGIALDPSTGALSGTPTAIGRYDALVTVADSRISSVPKHILIDTQGTVEAKATKPSGATVNGATVPVSQVYGGGSNVLPAGAEIVLTFAQPVHITARQVQLSAGGPFQVGYEPENRQGSVEQWGGSSSSGTASLGFEVTTRRVHLRNTHATNPLTVTQFRVGNGSTFP